MSAPYSGGNTMQRLRFGMAPGNFLGAAVLALCVAGSSAHANIITLPGYTVCQEAQNSISVCMSTVSGTLNYAGAAGVAMLSDDLGTATVGDIIGVGTSVSLASDFEPHNGEAGGTAQSTLTYEMEYYAPCAAPCTPSTASIGVSITASQSMTSAVSTVPGDFPYVQTWLNVENAAEGYSGLVLNESSCIISCPAGVGTTTGFPAGTNTLAISINENTAYLVQIGVFEESIGPATAEVDPTFTTTNTDGSFIYSAGIESESAAPEPSVWVTTLIGLLVGFRLRRKASAAGVTA